MENFNKYIIGSSMYGLTTPQSDVDLLTIYFDRGDFVSPMRIYPTVKETDNNNTKMYSLDEYARLLVKGNPNVVEVIYLTPEEEKSSEVTGFMNLLRDYPEAVAHKGVAKAYMGHLTGILAELTKKEVTPKRMSHAFRLCYSLKHLLWNRSIFLIRENEQARQKCLEVKTSKVTPRVQKELQMEVLHVEGLYSQLADSLQDSTQVKTLINSYFKDMYGV